MIYYDDRWRGSHGIGRFSAALLPRLPGVPLRISGNPAGPLDSLRVALALRTLPKGSVFFSPGYNTPLFSKVPFVFTLHDLNHIDRRENTSFLKRLYYRLILKRACQRAACVLTVSEYSKRRIVDWSGVSKDRVLTISNGVDSSFSSDGPAYAPGYPYLLCMGNRRLHKNEIRVIEAFSVAETPREMRLAFSGPSTEQLTSFAAKHRVQERVIFLGPIPERDLPSVYRGASALVFPSLYEGFGLPVLEAMACGTPVITSNTTALPEVAGRAALLVNPESVADIARAIDTILRNSELRGALRTEGLRQAAKFTWEASAAKLLLTLTEAELKDGSTGRRARPAEGDHDGV